MAAGVTAGWGSHGACSSRAAGAGARWHSAGVRRARGRARGVQTGAGRADGCARRAAGRRAGRRWAQTAGDSCHGRVSGINKICFLCSSYYRSQATAA